MRRALLLVLAAAAWGCAGENWQAPDAAGADAAADASEMSCAPTAQRPRGPSYLEGAPLRIDLNPLGWLGPPLNIVGRVVRSDCRTPIPGAMLDVWSADPLGVYDGGDLDPDGDPTPNPAWPLRGRVQADKKGFFDFHTLYPGAAAPRTRQLHVIVTAEGFVSLTTQIYFLNIEGNSGDAAYDRTLAVSVHDHGFAGLHAVLPIVLAGE